MKHAVPVLFGPRLAFRNLHDAVGALGLTSYTVEDWRMAVDDEPEIPLMFPR